MRVRDAPLAVDDVPWMERAACRGVDTALFFPVRGESASDAKAICDGCPVLADCRVWALTSPLAPAMGVCAGLAEQSRRRLRRQMGASPIRFPVPAAVPVVVLEGRRRSASTEVA